MKDQNLTVEVSYVIKDKNGNVVRKGIANPNKDKKK